MASSEPAAPHALELRAGELRLAVRPDLGGCLAGLWLGELPVLLSAEPLSMASVRPSASYPLVPYSNRIGYAHFRWHGHDVRTRPNFGSSPHSVHGVGWQRPWQVDEATDTQVRLSLDHRPDADWPFAFSCEQRISLSADVLRLDMSITNTDTRTQPAGLGWHPYFGKRARSRLHAEVSQRWESDASTELPTRRVAQSGIDGDIAHLAFDHCFEGWTGAARIRDEKLSLRLTSSLPYLVVYTPQTKPYFCVEPVSHVSNAHQMAEPLAHGLRELQPGERFSAWMELAVHRA
ncbi:MAG: aldose 1-epimerase [Rubrivivax sp.]|jgi:aldose 1-epimerase|nr:aldose 1-epimerase [Rubrivivax sp.]